jgi:CBS domain-containing protein
MLLKDALDSGIKQTMTTTAPAPLSDIIDLFINKNFCCVAVVDDEGRPVGIINDLDVMAAIHKVKGDYASLKAKDIMKNIPFTGRPDDDVADIIERMEKANLRFIPVVKGEKMIGLLSLQNIYRSRMKNMETEIRYLMDMLNKRDKSGDYDRISTD